MNKSNGTPVVGQVALWLSAIGAVNWGLVGIVDFDLVRAIFGGETSTDATAVSRVVYAVVGLAGLGLAGLGLRLAGRKDAHLEHGARAA